MVRRIHQFSLISATGDACKTIRCSCNHTRLYNKTTTAAAATTKGRPYLSPFVKKQVAAKQKWRCAVCRELLDETYEIDHIRPLHYAKNATEKRELNAIDNLQAKSAMEAQG